jgi:hypothetical protein
MGDNEERFPTGAALILVATGAAVLLLANLMGGAGDAPEASFPTSANQVPVIGVGEAIDIQARDDDGDIAVSGWFQQSMPVPCPAPLGPVVPLLDGDCSLDMAWLMAEPERLVHVEPNSMGVDSPTGAAIHPVFDGPGIAWARPLPQTGTSTPTPVVFIGHFDDSRAEGCQPEHLQLCRDRFVVSVVAWADGVDNP